MTLINRALTSGENRSPPQKVPLKTKRRRPSSLFCIAGSEVSSQVVRSVAHAILCVVGGPYGNRASLSLVGSSRRLLP